MFVFTSSRTRHADRLHRDLLTTTALALALGLAATGSAAAQAYNAGTGATSGGTNATAVGPNATGGGDESFAGGYNANSSGPGSVAIGSGAAAQSATQRQGIINYRDANGIGNAAAGTGGGNQTGANGNTTPPNETANGGAQPSGTAVGQKSTVGAGGGVAVGYANTAGSAANSTAVGSNNSAAGSYGAAIGYGNIANGRSTLSLGTNNQALGDIAIALGRQSYAVGDFSVAQGFIASAYGQDALALGRLSVAGESGANSTASNIAIGDNSRAVGGSALALGSGASATKARSVALGAGSMALRGTLSGTEAYTTTTLSSANTELSVGATGAERQITNVAGGQQDTDAVNVRQLRSVGNGVAGNATALGGSFGSDGTYTAPSYGYAGTRYNNVPDVVGAIDRLGLRYDTDTSGNRLASIDLTRGGSGSGGIGSAVGITGLAPATSDSGAVALSQMPLRYSTSANPTTANPAVPSNDVTLIGSNAGAPVFLHNVAPGSLASGSTDAVNGGQLFATDQNVATNASNLTALRGGLDAGTVGLVQQVAGNRTITVGSATDGNLVDLTGTAGARRLTGLAAGTGDGDAATIGQLRLSGNALAQGLGAGSAYNPVTGAFTAPSYAVGGQNYADVGSALSATNRLAVQYVPDGAGNNTGVVDLSRGNGGASAALRGVSAGRLASGSTDAVNGDQLYATNLRVATNTTDIATNAGAIGTLRQGVVDGTIGLVQQDPASRAIRVASATDGSLVSFANSAGNARTLSGVAAGAVTSSSTEAVNGSQLYATNRAVADNAAATSSLGQGIADGTVGLVRQDQISRDLAVGGTTDGTRISFRNASGGTRLLTGLSDGAIAAGSSEAITGNQLYGTNQAVAGNTSGLSDLRQGITGGTIGLVQQDAASRGILVATNTDGAFVSFANNAGRVRTLTGIGAGALASDSTEAVNGSQLYATNQSIAAGNASTNTLRNDVDAGNVGLIRQDPASRDLAIGGTTDGNRITLRNASGGNRLLTGLSDGTLAAGSSDAVTGSQLYATNQGVAGNASGLSDLRQGITGGTIGLVQQDAASRTITIASATDGTLVDLTGTGGTRRLAGLAAGLADTDAVNLGQLRLSGNALAQGLGAGAGYDPATGAYTAPSYVLGGRTYADVGSALAAADRLAVQYVPDGNGNPTDVVDLARGNGGNPAALRGVSAGRLAAGSTDAVNGDQLYATNQRVAANAADIAGSLGALDRGIATGSVGLLRQDQTTGALTIGAATGGTSLSLTNGSGQARTVSGVAAGALAAGSTDAVNGGQLYATNQVVAGLSAGLADGSVGLVRQDQTTRGLTVGAGTDGTSVSFADRTGTGRVLTGVAAGQIAAASTQAVNGGQIYGLSASLARGLGGGASVAADGSVTAPNYAIQGSTFGDVGSALGSLDAAVTSLNTVGSRYVAVRSTGSAAQATGADSVAIGPASVASADGGVALGANSIARRAGLSGATEAFSGITVASTAGAVSIGAAGAERQIVNLAGGTQDTDAVNLRQLRAVGGNLAGALGGGAGFAADGSFTGPSYAIGGRSYAGVGDALAAVDTFAVKYDVDPATGGRGQSLTLAGSDPNQPVLIRNVAAGILPTDAANVGQVAAQVATAKAQSFAYTDQRVQAGYAAGTAYTDARVAPLEKQMTAFGSQLAGLQNEVGQVRQEARRGAAIGLAAASLRFDDRPGKLSVAAGGGVWRGEGAASMGIGYTLPDGSARVNATGVAAGRDFGIGAGASFTLN